MCFKAKESEQFTKTKKIVFNQFTDIEKKKEKIL